jgi:MFS family permease
LVVAPFLANTWNWQAVWWFGSIFAAVIAVVILTLFRMPNKEETLRIHGESSNLDSPASKEESLATFKASLQVLKNGKIWLLALVFAIFNMVSPGGSINFMPTYLSEGLGLSLTVADLMTAVALGLVLVVEPTLGMISDKLGTRKKIIVIPAFCLIFSSLFIFNPALGLVGIWILMLVHTSLFSTGISVGTYAASPEMAGKPEYSGMAMGMAATGQNVGLLLGPLVFSNVLAMTGEWLSVAYFWLVPAAIVTFILSLFLKVR